MPNFLDFVVKLCWTSARYFLKVRIPILLGGSPFPVGSQDENWIGDKDGDSGLHPAPLPTRKRVVTPQLLKIAIIETLCRESLL